jgi:hypothetical protein
MARTVAPLLSFEGSGQIAKTQVYASWKGRPYVRRYTVPANPNSAEQQLTRNTFRFLTNLWKFFPGSAVDAWQAYADSNRFTDRNGFIKLNNGPLREEVDLLNMTISPAAKSGIIASAMVLTAGAGQITVDLTAPSLPTGWTVTKAYAAAIRNQDPQTESFYTVVAGEDAAAPWSIVLAGLTAAEEYLVGGWFQFTRPDGTFAYGQSLQDTETPA